ncbi:MAG: DNA internalization-related competence protein ComEC/Rec2 [Bacteroidetes bacterium]|nr:DNA internalization-related competence protein ComEC/Rec2 [Bacteroidota bacterium]
MNDFAVIKFSIVFVFGILLLPLVQVNILSLIILIILLLLLTIILKRKRVFEKYNIFLTVISLLLIISLGNITSQFSKVQLNTFVSNLYKEKNVIVSGKIDKIELEREYEIQFLLSADKFMVNDITVNDKMIFLCKLRGNEKGRVEFYQMMKPGFEIELTGRFKKGRERRNPGEFDYNAYLKTKGIEGIITIDTLTNIKVIYESPELFSNSIFQVRKYINKQISLMHNSETAALLRGLLLADRREIDQETKTQFINSGVIHVLAVSGLHVGFIALIFIILFGRFNIYLRSVLTIIGLLLFMILTGVPPSVFRATVMALVIIVAFLTNRSTNIFNSLAIAALIILIINPDEIYSPGFQLSFSAVIAIGVIYPIISRVINRLQIKSKFVRYVLLFMAVSFAAQIGTMPFTLIYFGKLSVIALAANIIVIPAIGIIISLAVVTLIIGSIFPPIALYYAAANDLITWLMLNLINFTGDLNFSHFRIVGYSIYDSVVFYFFIALFIYFIGRYKTKLAIVILLILTISNVILFSFLDDEELLPENQLSVLMVDVGQGDSFIIKFPNNKTALIDAGEATFYFDYGERVILPLLNYLGIEKIDYGFVSHLDLDHYGGFVALILEDRIGEIYKPALDTSLTKDLKFEKFLKNKNIPITYYDKQSLEIGNCKVYILTNKEESEFYSLSSNNRSGILKIVYGESSFLFTGDAEKRVENILIDNYQSFLDVDVLKVGHHGSKTSSYDEFLQYTSPQYALISAGIKNKFGHPAQNVISKFKSNNVKILRTDKNGAVLMVSNGEQIFAENWK